MGLNQVSEGVIINGVGARKQSPEYKKMSWRSVQKEGDSHTMEFDCGHEHYVEPDQMLTGEQQIGRFDVNYKPGAAKKMSKVRKVPGERPKKKTGIGLVVFIWFIIYLLYMLITRFSYDLLP